jgi:dephospho-CoA kinase
MPNDASPRGYLIVGVTGGIGSGKSTVCRLFERLGRKVLQADLIARAVTETDPEVRRAVRLAFGEAAYGPDGRLQRTFLADRVFSHPHELRRLNAIVHPAVFQAIDREIEALPPAGRCPYVIVEAALIYESGFDGAMDYVIVVDAPEELRVRRIMERDGLQPGPIRLRMKAQLPAAAKRERADFVIINEGAEGDLVPRVQFLDTLLSSIASRTP